MIGFHSRIVLIIGISVLTVACTSSDGIDNQDARSGVRGRMFWDYVAGPVTPSPKPPSFSPTGGTIHITSLGGNGAPLDRVIRVADSGRFSVRLSPGDYHLQPEAAGAGGDLELQTGPQDVVVTTGDFTVVRLYLFYVGP